MHDWLEQMKPGQRVLDLGAGAGSLGSFAYPCMIVSVDCDDDSFANAYASAPTRVIGRGEQLPFTASTFDLVLCHHFLEHVANLTCTLSEISRVLKPDGRLYVAVPNGYGLCDGIYRYVFHGGDHVNRFSQQTLITLVERAIVVRLTSWQKLYSSFAYLSRIKQLNKAILSTLPARVRVLFFLPRGIIFLFQASLYLGTRFLDYIGGSSLALYGWAFYFAGVDASPNMPAEIAAYINVCLYCGSGHAATDLRTRFFLFYRCPTCSRRGLYFPPFATAI